MNSQSIKLPQGLRLEPERNSDASYLTEKHFLLTIAAVFALHILALWVWELMPRDAVLDIPVRALSIKLGDDPEIELAPENATAADTSHTVAKKMEKAPEKPQAEDNKDAVNKALDHAIADPKPVADAPVAEPRQFVRQNSSPAALKASGGLLGNSKASNAELLTRYEQLVSLWIQKFKVYPPEAQAQGIKGETVVHVSIDRYGNIRSYGLERSTGSPVLDKAALDMVARANPVPAMPDDMSSDELQDFLIPVIYK